MSRQPPEDVAKAAQAAMKAYHIPASVTLAQWIIESGWGAHMPAGSNNPFGEKAVSGQAHVDVTTREVVHGKTIWIVQPFRKYPSIEAAFMSHAQHLATSTHYKFALKFLPDVFDYIDAIGPIYATDPAYARSLKSMIQSQSLTKYDQ